MREKNKMIINRTNQNTKFADNNVDRPIPYKVNP
jgi:hypothetical protein